MNIDTGSTERIVEFPGLTNASKRTKAFNIDQKADEEIQRDAVLAGFLQNIRSVNDPYFKGFKKAIELGDADELISSTARNLRALVTLGANHLDKLGIPASKTLRKDEKLSWYEVKWKDRLEVSEHLPHSFGRFFDLTSHVYFQKNWNSSEYLRAYVLDLEREGSKDQASLSLLLDQKQILAQQLKWKGSSWNQNLDSIVATRLLNGMEPQLNNPHRALMELDKHHHTILGCLILGSTNNPDPEKRRSGYVLSPWSEGIIELQYTEKPLVRIEGKSLLDKLNRTFAYDLESGQLTRQRKPGEEPQQFCQGSELTSHQITQRDFINFLRACLVLAPSSISKDTKMSLPI